MGGDGLPAPLTPRGGQRGVPQDQGMLSVANAQAGDPAAGGLGRAAAQRLRGGPAPAAPGRRAALAPVPPVAERGRPQVPPAVWRKSGTEPARVRQPNHWRRLDGPAPRRATHAVRRTSS